MPRSAAAVSCESVVLGQVAGDVHGQRLHAGPQVLRGEPAQDLGERQVRRDRSRRLGGQQRSVDRRIGAERPARTSTTCSAGFLGHAQLGLGREGAQVRRQDGVWCGQKGLSAAGGSFS